jgi:RNA polymerase sigma factor (sigma-70 family)
LRSELHRYCARLTGSVIDGEDVVQDTMVRAFMAWPDLDELTPLRPWLFRIAHNRALDLLRSRAVRHTEPIDAAPDVADPASPDPMEVLMRQQAVETAVSRAPPKSGQNRLSRAAARCLAALCLEPPRWLRCGPSTRQPSKCLRCPTRRATTPSPAVRGCCDASGREGEKMMPVRVACGALLALAFAACTSHSWMDGGFRR